MSNIKNLITKFCNGYEFETRYYLDPRVRRPGNVTAPKYQDSFQNIVKAILAKLTDRTVTQTSFIDLLLGDVRKRIIFQGDKREIQWIRKVKKAEPYIESNDFGGFKCDISEEQSIEPQKLDRVEHILLKSRLSYEFGDWRLEISAVKRANLQNIQALKLEFLSITDPFAKWGFWDFWEFEREYVGGDSIPATIISDIYDMYETLAPMVDFKMICAVRDIAQEILHPNRDEFKKLSPRLNLSRLLPKAIEVTLDRWTSDFWAQWQGMIVRDKIDGERELLRLKGGRALALGTCNLEEFECPEFVEEFSDGLYIFDTEFWDGCWFILHVLVWDDKRLLGDSDSERLSVISQSKVQWLSVCAYRIVDHADDFETQLTAESEYPKDGCIITTDKPYWEQYSLKWKERDRSTLDVLVMKCPDWLEGKHPFVRTNESDTLYLLHVGDRIHSGNPKPVNRYYEMFAAYMPPFARYGPIPFAPAECVEAFIWSTEHDNLHGQICEIGRTADGQWTLHRIRTDRKSLINGGYEVGNDVKVALDIWQKYTVDFPISYLANPPLERCTVTDWVVALKNKLMDLLTEINDDESISTLLMHMCPFADSFTDFPNVMTLNPSNPAAKFQIYTPRVKSQRVIIQKYAVPGKVVLPKMFIGGAKVVITMDPELLGHLSCVSKWVANGGKLIMCVKFDDADENDHPRVCRVAIFKELDRIGFQLIEDRDLSTVEEWDLDRSHTNFHVLVFKKENRGASEQSCEDVCAESEHLSGNPEANFSFKFMRQKTKDITTLTVERPVCDSLHVDARRGRLLCAVEFLVTVNETAQVAYVGPDLERLKVMFPKLNFLELDTATYENVEVLIYHGSYEEGVARRAEWRPKCSLLEFGADDTVSPILKGKVYFIPYGELESTRVVLWTLDRDEYWNILPVMFRGEMNTFNRVYRPSAFKYAQRLPGMDNCYDCRSACFVATKYARLAKISVADAVTKLAI